MDTNEKALIDRCRRGDKEAFGHLVRRYAGPAQGTAALLLGCQDEAMDASQEAFVKAWRAIKRFDGRAKFYTWFSTILRNVCISRLRRRKRRKTVELTDGHAEPHPDADPVYLAQRSDRKRRVWQAIQSLSPMHREIIVMSHFQHLSYKQIAAELDIPMGTVTSRLYAARQALKKILAPHKSDGPAHVAPLADTARNAPSSTG